MSSGLKNSILILSLAILLPVAIFTGVEVASLNENENMLEQVYREQLDGIIFSINQYGADLLDFYVQQIDYTYNQGGVEALAKPEAIKGNLAIEFLAIREGGKNLTVDYKRPNNVPDMDLDSLFNTNLALVERLVRYKEADYIKLETLGNFSVDGSSLQVSMIVIGENTSCLVFFDPVIFIEDLLAPKIQQITTQVINVSIMHSNSNNVVYQSENAPVGIIQTGTLGSTPGFNINVSLEAESVTDLIAYRTRRNLIALSAMVLIIVIGMILIVRNLKKEIQLNKAKADFVANVSHEIRTPLSLISMFNETLLMGRVKEEKRVEYYEIIAKETSRLKNIVNKILSFSQIDAQKKSYNFLSFHPDGKVREIVNSYSYHLSEKGFTYETDLKADQSINADEEAFAEVVINLIDNAMKYSTENKHISISSKIEDQAYILSLTDQGVGIDPKHQKHIFDKFYRVDGGDVHNTKGTGLGLALVHEIINTHNGKIEVSSEPGKGSTFTVKLPLK